MRLALSLVFGYWLSACWLGAQVTAEVVLDEEYFLPGESIVVSVRISNLSGQTLQLGKDPDWLTFAVEAKDSD